METWAIPFAALVISVATLIGSYLNNRLSVQRSYVDSLEQRVTRLEAHVAECERDRERLSRENISLMRRLMDANT